MTEKEMKNNLSSSPQAKIEPLRSSLGAACRNLGLGSGGRGSRPKIVGTGRGHERGTERAEALNCKLLGPKRALTCIKTGLKRV